MAERTIKNGKRIISILMITLLIAGTLPLLGNEGKANAESNITLTTTTLTCSKIKGYFTVDYGATSISGFPISSIGITYTVSIYPESGGSSNKLTLTGDPTVTESSGVYKVAFETSSYGNTFEDGTYVIALQVGMKVGGLNMPAITQSEKRTIAHSWGSGTVTSYATCTSDGAIRYACSRCGVTMTESIPKLEHTWDSGKVTSQPKYFTNGIRTYTCEECGATKNQTIAKLNIARVTPAATKIKSAKVKGKKLTVKWNRVAANTVGYQICLKDKKTGKLKYYNVKQGSKATMSKTISKLTKKRTYAVRLRPYNIVEGRTVYGKWSNVKSGKVK